MNGPTLAGIAGISGALILVLGALRGRRLGMRRIGWLALAWLGIILLVWAAVTVGVSLSGPQRNLT